MAHFLKTAKELMKQPELLAMWALVALTIALFAANAFFIPPLLLILSGITLAGILPFIVYDRIRLSRALRESEFSHRKLEVLTAHMKDGVVIHDIDFSILAFNHAAEVIFNLKAEEVIGKTIKPSFIQDSKFSLLAQAIFPSLAPSLIELSESGTWPQILRVTLDSGAHLEIVVNRLSNERGELIGFLKIIKDQTRERELLKSKSEFISVAAHQLRTPLTAIHWALENIVKTAEEKNPDIASTAKEALQVAERALKITNDLLDVSKLEEGKFGFSFEETDLVALIENVLRELRPLAAQYEVSLSFLHPSLPSLVVFADPVRLSMALVNFLDNAVRYNTRGGKATISLSLVPREPFVKISIQDTGIGIPQEELKHIFQKLYRAQNAVQIEPNGTGLGLYISKNIIERHGGTLGVESTINRGTLFWFTLPLEKKLIPQKAFQPEE